MTPMEDLGIGVMVRFAKPPEESFAQMRAMNLRHCQFAAPPDEYLYGAAGRENTAQLREQLEKYDICPTSLFISFPDQDWKDWKNGVGLVPEATRALRLTRACRSADWARELGITQIASHVGCVPEAADSPLYQGFVRDLRGLLRLVEANEQFFAYETGQESLDTLIRLMNDADVACQRINFDPANLLIYNYDAPLALVEKLADKVVHIHCKDAVRPSDGAELGRETRLGEGDTQFVKLFHALTERGYRGPLTIEREVATGTELQKDMNDAIQLLQELRAPYLKK